MAHLEEVQRDEDTAALPSPESPAVSERVTRATPVAQARAPGQAGTRGVEPESAPAATRVAATHEHSVAPDSQPRTTAPLRVRPASLLRESLPARPGKAPPPVVPTAQATYDEPTAPITAAPPGTVGSHTFSEAPVPQRETLGAQPPPPTDVARTTAAPRQPSLPAQSVHRTARLVPEHERSTPRVDAGPDQSAPPDRIVDPGSSRPQVGTDSTDAGRRSYPGGTPTSTQPAAARVVQRTVSQQQDSPAHVEQSTPPVPLPIAVARNAPARRPGLDLHAALSDTRVSLEASDAPGLSVRRVSVPVQATPPEPPTEPDPQRPLVRTEVQPGRSDAAERMSDTVGVGHVSEPRVEPRSTQAAAAGVHRQAAQPRAGMPTTRPVAVARAIETPTAAPLRETAREPNVSRLYETGAPAEQATLHLTHPADAERLGPQQPLVPLQSPVARRPGLDLHAALSDRRISPLPTAAGAVAGRGDFTAVHAAPPKRLPGLDLQHAFTSPTPHSELRLATSSAPAPAPLPTSPVAPAPPALAVAPPPSSPPVQRVQTDASTPEQTERERLSEAPDDELEELADRLYDHIRARFRTELLIDRERAGLLADRY